MSDAAIVDPAGFAQFAPAIPGAVFQPVVQSDVAKVSFDVDDVAGFTAVNSFLGDFGGSLAPGYLLIDLTRDARTAEADLKPALLSTIAANRAPVIRIALLGGQTDEAQLALALISHVIIARRDTSVLSDWRNPSLRGAIARRTGAGGLQGLNPSMRDLTAQDLHDRGLVDDVVEDVMLAALAYVRKNRRRHNGELAVYRSREQSRHVTEQEMERLGGHWPYAAIPAPNLRLESGATF